MKDLYFDVRDVCRTSRIALSGKKIWVHILGLLSGWIGYFILTYIALLASGQALPEIWNSYHLFPCLIGGSVSLPWFSWLIYALGILLWVFIFLFFSAAVSRIAYKQLKGDEFFSSGDSIQYAKKHAKAALFSPVPILLIIAFFIVMAIIAAWIAQWPVLDIIFLGLPYLLYFVVAVFVLYTALSFLVSFILGPSIVGTAEEDTMETVFQSYSTLWAQPWRLVCYEVVVGLTTAISTIIYGYFMIGGYKFFNYVFGQEWLMGGKLTRIVEKASSYIWGSNSIISDFITQTFQIELSSAMTASNSTVAGTEIVVVILVGIALFLITASVLAYALTNITVGQSIIYIILRKKKDSENLLERKDEDEIEEEEEMEDIPDIDTDEFDEEVAEEEVEPEEEETDEAEEDTEEEDK